MSPKNTVSKKAYERLQNVSHNEENFRAILRMLGPHLLKGMQSQLRFHPVRKWRFDFAWEPQKVAVEVDGIAYQAGGGHHISDKDREKINEAVCMGWRVIKFSGKQITNEPDYCINTLKRLLEQK